jgi:hypothetical protein
MRATILRRECDLDGPVINVRYQLGNGAEPVTQSESFS